MSAAFPVWQDTLGYSLGYSPETGLAKESNGVKSLTIIQAFVITTLALDVSEPECLLFTAPDTGQLSWRSMHPTQPKSPHISTALLNASGAVAVPWTMLLILYFGLFWLDRW